MTTSATKASASSNRVVLVTGATSGIGVEIARRCVAAGDTVALTGRNRERGTALAEQLGSRAHFFASDLTETGAAARLVRDTVKQLGRIDVLVNNAGIDHTNDLLDVTEAEIADTFATNTFAPMNLLIAVAAHMRQRGQGGSVINVTSRLAHIGVPTMGIYSASKGAVYAFTKAAAVDLAPFQIRVNAVAPGMTRTPLYEEWLQGLPDPEGEAAAVAAAIPLGRIADPVDVAAAVLFLASPEAAYITGVTLPVDGGYLAQ